MKVYIVWEGHRGDPDASIVLVTPDRDLADRVAGAATPAAPFCGPREVEEYELASREPV